MDESDPEWLDFHIEPAGGLPRFVVRLSRGALAERIAAAVMALPAMAGCRLIGGSINTDEEGVTICPSHPQPGA